MPLPRRVTLPIPAERPTWITARMLRLATLSAFVVAIGMTGAHLSRRPGVPEVFRLTLRRTGLPLLGLVFLLTWTLVYVALRALHPVTAFQGMPPRPRSADRQRRDA